MYIHGSFINKLGQTVTVEMVTKGDRSRELEIGTEEAGLWFAAEDAVVIEAETNDTFDVMLRRSCAVRLLSRGFVPDFFCANCREAVVNVRLDGRCVFAGFIEPMSLSQPFNDLLDEVELSCVDALSALQYSKYRDVGAAGVLYLDVKGAATTRTFADILTEVIGGVASGLDLSGGARPRLLYDGSRAAGADTGSRYDVFSRLAVPELLFLGDTEDDVWGQDEVVEEMLRYLDLHITQEGTDFHIFSWQTLRSGAGSDIEWRDLADDGAAVVTKRASRTVTASVAADCSTRISVGEVYNKLVLTCDTNGSDNLVESPLSADSLVPLCSARQKYMTVYKTAGEGTTSLQAWRDMLRGRVTTYGGATQTEWYVQVMDNPGWTFYYYQGGRFDIKSLAADGKHQERVPQRLGNAATGAALMSLGSCKVDVAGRDNAPTSPSMSDCLVIKAPGITSDITTEEEDADTVTLILRDCIPLGEYTGRVAGGALSPSDDAITNYIVFSGKITLVPVSVVPAYVDVMQGIDDEAAGLVLDEWWKTWWHQTVNAGDYVTRRFWQAENPSDEPETDMDGEFGLYPMDDGCMKLYEYRYSSVGTSTDTVSKVAVLCCMLTVGGKCLVETGTGEGMPGDFVWRDFMERSECADDEEFYRQSFTIGINPKIGDMVIGSEFDIQDNNFGLGIDERGTCVPVSRSDALSGDVSFRILGLVNSMWKDTYVSREPDFFHHTEWAENMVCLLAHTSAVVIKDFEIKIVSDAMGGTTAGNEIVYMSDTREGFVNVKDDIEFRIHSALTTGALTATDTVTGRTAKPEQLYVDAYYDEYHAPLVEMEQSVTDDGAALSPFDRWTHPALGTGMYVTGMGRNLMEGTAQLKLKQTQQ